MAFSKHGKYWYAKDSWQDYEDVPWHTISDSSRRKIMKHLIPKPAACPFCGAESRREERGGFGSIWGDGMSERVLILVNRSGKLQKDTADWYWTCRDCYQAERKKALPVREYVKLGDKLKPWEELTRQGKMFRIRKVLPMPDYCPYCDRTILELFSMSGTWPEDDITDYDWVCRSHALELADLLHEKPVPLEPADPDLFPWWKYNEAGVVQGPSILEKCCAMGRFLHVRKKVSGKRVP